MSTTVFGNLHDGNGYRIAIPIGCEVLEVEIGIPGCNQIGILVAGTKLVIHDWCKGKKNYREVSFIFSQYRATLNVSVVSYQGEKLIASVVVTRESLD